MRFSNVFGAIITFLAATALIFFLGIPIYQWIEANTTGDYKTAAQIAFFIVAILIQFYIPINMAISDDTDQASTTEIG